MLVYQRVYDLVFWIIYIYIIYIPTYITLGKKHLIASYIPIFQPGASSLIPTDSTGAAGPGDVLICSLVVVGFFPQVLQFRQHMDIYLSICLSIYLSLSLYPSIHPSIHLSIYLYIYIYIYNSDLIGI